MKPVFAPMAPCLGDLIYFAAARKEAKHLLAYRPSRESFQVLFEPLPGNRLPGDVTGKLPATQSVLKLCQDFRIGQPRHRNSIAAFGGPVRSPTTLLLRIIDLRQ
jgi:hypothetical protein